MTINPDTPAAQQLRDWYATEGRDSGFTAVNEGLANAIRRDGSNASSRNTRTALADIVKTTNLPPVDAKPEYFTAIVTVAKIQDEQSMYYCACPENNRKVIEAPGGNGWLCEYDGQTYASMVRRYVLSALVKDHTGRAYVSIFNNDVWVVEWGGDGAGGWEPSLLQGVTCIEPGKQLQAPQHANTHHRLSSCLVCPQMSLQSSRRHRKTHRHSRPSSV